MIALDTSAVVAILREEDEAPRFLHLIERRKALIGIPTLLECHIVLNRDLDTLAGPYIRTFLGSPLIQSADFTAEMLQQALDGFARFGKGRGHPARLNFGDCLSYAVAKHHGIPLLFKGDDFRHTDIEPALQ